MSFYGDAQAAIHHQRFGDLARDAAATVITLLHEQGLDTGTVTDLGSGSGILAAALLDAGYDVTGIDLSPDMVAIARRTAPTGTFRCESVIDAEIPPSVAVTAVGEVLCYATDERAGLDALTAVAGRVHTALVPGGVFVFDVSTPGRNFDLDVRHVFHDTDEWSLGMHATESDGRLDRRIVIFRRRPDGTYERTDEHHVVRLYEPAAVQRALTALGFEVELRARYGAEPSASTPPSGWCVVVATTAM